ncbi:MAG: hypothetical protein A3J93_03455 [Candidatus Magasanikbacteria bacterium RIFOXYC2_FULL_42_28]|uniref:tRNA pseudouridine synthase B n=1 Tax=Candidatus Magasanikbacteria bacterium RIFOXYC2_FULL_42_28 TaxID=1798704 RepID=A0A1F6NUG0_9BACT|nr:MAG: hypothetical protein A3J93_03455 [Candidatus Magasanikbacteria bacterium RIFOXYC2_FULL_42_28]
MTKTQLPTNFLLINKPINWTSFDVVGFIRKNLINNGAPKNIRVGHAGTLDPFATGLLIVGVGREATKRLDEFKNLRKTYVATIRLGAVSDTGDCTGTIIPFQKKSWILNIKYWILKKIGRDGDSSSARASVGMTIGRPDTNIQYPIFNILSPIPPTLELTQKIIKSFIGKNKQVPPMYSAKKIAGKKLYELARVGKTVERKPSAIEIYDIKLLDYVWPNLTIEVTCSAGTYIRTLAEDIGKKLGTGAYCQALTRTQIGEYGLTDARSPAEATKNPNILAD